MPHCPTHCPTTSILRVSALAPPVTVTYLGYLLAAPVATVVVVAAICFVVGVVGVFAREVLLRRLDDRREAAVREHWAAEAAQREAEEREPQALPAGQRQLEAAPIRVAAFRVDERAREVA